MMALALLVRRDGLVSSFSVVGWRTRFRKPTAFVYCVPLGDV